VGLVAADRRRQPERGAEEVEGARLAAVGGKDPGITTHAIATLHTVRRTPVWAIFVVQPSTAVPSEANSIG
jgi:hypothetical protein